MPPKKPLYDVVASGSGFVVFVDDAPQTQHSQERKAQQSAAEFLAADPSARVYYEHDYRVRLVWQADPEPEPPSPEPQTLHGSATSDEMTATTGRVHAPMLPPEPEPEPGEVVTDAQMEWE
jgi:hypothetical protein